MTLYPVLRSYSRTSTSDIIGHHRRRIARLKESNNNKIAFRSLSVPEKMKKKITEGYCSFCSTSFIIMILRFGFCAGIVATALATFCPCSLRV